MKLLNKILIIATLIASLIAIIIDDTKNIVIILKNGSILFTLLVPYIFEKVTKYTLTDFLKTIWIIFIILAHFFGVILEFYNIYPGFDKLTHTLSGFLSAYIGFLLIGKQKSKFINVLVIVSFSALCALSWEIFEFTCNILVGGDAQRVAETGVDDTMWDMIVALIGALIYSVFSVKYSDK